MSTSARNPQPGPEAADSPSSDQTWQVVLWHDPITTETYIEHVLRQRLGFPPAVARALVKQLRHSPRVELKTGARERIEAAAVRATSYGLAVTIEEVG